MDFEKEARDAGRLAAMEDLVGSGEMPLEVQEELYGGWSSVEILENVTALQRHVAGNLRALFGEVRLYEDVRLLLPGEVMYSSDKSEDYFHALRGTSIQSRYDVLAITAQRQYVGWELVADVESPDIHIACLRPKSWESS